MTLKCTYLVGISPDFVSASVNSWLRHCWQISRAIPNWAKNWQMSKVLERKSTLPGSLVLLFPTLVAVVLVTPEGSEKLSKIDPLPSPAPPWVFFTQRPPLQWRPWSHEVPCRAAAFGDLKKSFALLCQLFFRCFSSQSCLETIH